MKKTTLVGIITGMLIALPGSAFAAQFMADEQTIFGTGETSAGNLYMAGGSVSMAGNVKGDLVAAGGTVVISGPVNSDLLASGGTITLTGEIGGDARIAGGNVTLQNKVAGDLVLAGGQVSVAGSQVGGDAMIAGGTIIISSPVSGNLKVFGGDVRIDAPIKGSVEIKASTVTLGPKAVIDGNLTYTASDPATFSEGAVVRGKTNFQKNEVDTVKPIALGALMSLALLGKLLMTLACAVVVYLLFPRYLKDMLSSVTRNTVENLGRGFVALIVVPIGSVLLMFTVLGLPLGFLGIAAFVATMIFVSIVAPIITGSLLFKWIWRKNEYEITWTTVILGVFAYVLIGLIPLVGWIAKFAIMLITLGAVVHSQLNALKSWRV